MLCSLERQPILWVTVIGLVVWWFGFGRLDGFETPIFLSEAGQREEQATEAWRTFPGRFSPNSRVELANDWGSGRGARVCGPQRIATSEGSGKPLTHSTADALRISNPRSASKPSAPADSEAASTSAFELITAQSYFESGLGTAIQIQFPNPVNSEACYE